MVSGLPGWVDQPPGQEVPHPTPTHHPRPTWTSAPAKRRRLPAGRHPRGRRVHPGTTTTTTRTSTPQPRCQAPTNRPPS